LYNYYKNINRKSKLERLSIYDPYEHSTNAFQKGFYIESIQILHEWFKLKSAEILILGRHKILYGSNLDYLELAQELTLSNLAKSIYILGKINLIMYKEVIKYNNFRNKLIHSIYFQPNYEVYKGIPIKDITVIHKLGLKLYNKYETILVKMANR
jgi:hypothetical protein